MSDLILSQFNQTIKSSKDGILIDDAWSAIINQIGNPEKFFDKVISEDYFGLFLPVITVSSDELQLSHSPADYIMFPKNSQGFISDQWISRTHLIATLSERGYKNVKLPSFYSLKICAPKTTVYQLLNMITAMVTCFLENEVEDRLFLDGLRLSTGGQFRWHKMPIIEILTSL